MRHTLKDYMKTYKPDTIQLLYGEHLVSIDTARRGSYTLLRTFENEKFYFKSCNDSNLILDYVEN